MSVLTKNLTDCNKIMYGLNFNVLLYLLITADASKPQRPKKDSESSTREELEEEKKRLREVSQQCTCITREQIKNPNLESNWK